MTYLSSNSVCRKLAEARDVLRSGIWNSNAIVHRALREVALDVITKVKYTRDPIIFSSGTVELHFV